MNVGGLAVESGDLPPPRVHLMPDLLRWEETSRAEMDAVFEGYVALVSHTLSRALRDCQRQDGARARDLAAKVKSAPAYESRRVLLAPDFTCRLLWPHPERLQRMCGFLDQALHVEGVINGREDAVCDGWTALGDSKVLRSGETLRGVVISGLPALDFDSPNVASGEFAPLLEDNQVRFPPLPDDARPLTIDRLTTASGGISATNTLVADLIARFVQVILLRTDRSRTDFSSGSYRRYIGRIILGNPHAESVSDITLAEAMVHEAIHALLYMTLYPVPWGVDNGHTDAAAGRVVSPWTGARLKVSSFLQACFVWYGLLQFWDRAVRLETFENSAGAHERMTRALGGFSGKPLLDNLGSEVRKNVRGDVCDAIQTIQRRAIASFF
jgi:hypothetical protein